MADSFDLVHLKAKAFRGVFTLTFRRLILKIFDTVAVIFLARALSTSAYGVFGIVSFIVFTFLSFFSDVGFGAALIQKKEDITEKDAQTTFTIQQILVTVLLAAAWIASPYLAHAYNLGDQGSWLIRVLSLSLFITSFKTIPSIMLERQLKFDILIIPDIVESLTYDVIAVVMALSGYGVWSLVVAVVIRSLVGAVALNLLRPWKIGWHISRDSAHELLHFGVPYQLNSALSLLKDNITPTVIAFWFGPAAVGFVTLAENIATRPMEIIDIVSRVMFPAYSRIQGDLPRIKRWIEKSVSFMAYIYMPMIAGLIITAPGILQYLYADKSAKWLPALPTLLLFLAGAFPIIVTTTYTNALYALGKPKTVLLFMVVYTAMTWGLGLPLIHRYGFVGIAIAGLVITYTTLPFVVYAMNRVVHVETWNSVKKPLLAAAIMSAVIYVSNRVITHDLLSLVVTIVIGVITYAGAILALDRDRLESEFTNWWGMIGKTNKAAELEATIEKEEHLK